MAVLGVDVVLCWGVGKARGSLAGYFEKNQHRGHRIAFVGGIRLGFLYQPHSLSCRQRLVSLLGGGGSHT